MNILDGNAENLQLECDEYERKIKSYGGIELFLGGIGPDGHIACMLTLCRCLIINAPYVYGS